MIVIGKGLIANAFLELDLKKDVLIFASGVSNSKRLTKDDCDREQSLLIQYLEKEKDKTLVYFSTYSINNKYEKDSDYVQHKTNMENYIIKHASNYLIVRTSNIVGRKANSTTIFNYLLTKIRERESFDLWSRSYRNILDVDDLVSMVRESLDAGFINQILYLINPDDISVFQLVKKMEVFLNEKAIFTISNKGSQYEGIDYEYSKVLFDRLKINRLKYIDNILNKYYSNEKGQKNIN